LVLRGAEEGDEKERKGVCDQCQASHRDRDRESMKVFQPQKKGKLEEKKGRKKKRPSFCRGSTRSVQEGVGEKGHSKAPRESA